MNAVQKRMRGRPRKDAKSRGSDRQVMIDAAVALLQDGGGAAFNARHVAERTGTAVGAIYTQFDSLEALRLEANAVTMRQLRDALAGALTHHGPASVEQRLLVLADEYLRFAAAHRNAWASLFEPRTIPAPPAIEADIAALFGILEGVLRDAGLRDETKIPLVAKALWSSVHGMIYLAEIGGLGPVRTDEVPQMIRVLVQAAVLGLTAGIPPGRSNADNGDTPSFV